MQKLIEAQINTYIEIYQYWVISWEMGMLHRLCPSAGRTLWRHGVNESLTSKTIEDTLIASIAFSPNRAGGPPPFTGREECESLFGILSGGQV